MNVIDWLVYWLANGVNDLLILWPITIVRYRDSSFFYASSYFDLFPFLVHVVGWKPTLFQVVRVGEGRSRALDASLPRTDGNRGDAEENLVRKQQDCHSSHTALDATLHRSPQSILHLPDLLHGVVVNRNLTTLSIQMKMLLMMIFWWWWWCCWWKYCCWWCFCWSCGWGCCGFSKIQKLLLFLLAFISP